MDIMTRIQKTTEDHLCGTGISPNNIYLGRSEMAELMLWAESNAYIKDSRTTGREEAERPEVAGMPVYEVNANSHMRCSV